MDYHTMEMMTVHLDKPPKGAPTHVLMAEDDVLLANTVAEFLHEAGFMVTFGRDGAQAIALADSIDFDVLLTDLRMPNIDGPTLIRRLRTKRPYLPVVVMSGNVQDGWRAEIPLAPDGRERMVLLDKPMSMARLCQALADVMALGIPELNRDTSK